MARASRELAIPHLAQCAAQRLLGHDDAKFLENPLAEIDDSPPHDAVNRRNRSALEDRGERSAMLAIQPRRLPRSFAVDQAARPMGVEPERPVANDLETDAPDTSPPQYASRRRKSLQEPAIAALAARPSNVSPSPAPYPRRSRPEDQSLPPWRTPFRSLRRSKFQLMRESPP
jgi:hypothetical protein